jgi:hypothetical protein
MNRELVFSVGGLSDSLLPCLFVCFVLLCLLAWETTCSFCWDLGGVVLVHLWEFSSFLFPPLFFFIYIYCVISFVLCSRFDCVLFLHGTKFFFPLSSVRKVIVHIDV